MQSRDESSSARVFTMSEVKALGQQKDKCILVINNHVYDVTKFLDEHPGGEEVLKEQNGKNASDAFEDVGHSNDAREQMRAYEIGILHPDEAKPEVKSKPLVGGGTDNRYGDDNGSSWSKWIIPLVLAVAAAVIFKLLADPDPTGNKTI